MKEFLQSIMDNDVVESRKARDEKLVSKWAPSGLLEGLEDPIKRRNMARLFENQKDHFKSMLLNEQTSMAGGDIQGFAAVAFPIIRRVFGDLVSTSDIVSVQTMDQPVGLVFVLDFIAGTNKSGMGVSQNASFYGGGRVGAEILTGVNLTGSDAESGFYSLNQGYSSPSGSASVSFLGPIGAPIASGTVGATNYTLDALCGFDPDLSGSFITVMTASKSSFSQLNEKAYAAIADGSTLSGTLVKRLTKEYSADRTKLLFFYSSSAAADHVALTGSVNGNPAEAGASSGYTRTIKYPIFDDFVGTGVLSAIKGDPSWGFEFDGNAGSQEIPEVDLKVDAFNIQTVTKMLKARWTAQASQDLSAWQNLDAEVELTSFLSEQVAMEIDMEVLRDLVESATGTVQYWSRRPGRFVNRDTGEVISVSQTGDFTGNVAEWYQTLIETINGASAQIARKVLKGGANFLVCGPEVQNILETTNAWFANTTVGEESTGEVGIKKEGSLRKKWDVYVTPYFYRNLILIGRKGASNLETGYVYAPYVPLITSPAIPDPTDIFKYAKGVMTRYGKRMIRPDMYGKVVVQNLIG